jgi:ABC-type transporter Mla maintaining outer membrane lipid asymmetry ATPase subunit MlaF
MDGHPRTGDVRASQMTPAVSFSKVSRHFGQVRAVDGIDLEIFPGEFFAMLGPSSNRRPGMSKSSASGRRACRPINGT